VEKGRIKGRFITVEGIEGAGKSTVMGFIKEQLDSAGISCVVTREPGGTPIAESIRQVLLNSGVLILSVLTSLVIRLFNPAITLLGPHSINN